MKFLAYVIDCSQNRQSAKINSLPKFLAIWNVLFSAVLCRPVRYYDNIVYRDIFSNIAIRYFLLDIAITAIKI